MAGNEFNLEGSGLILDLDGVNLEDYAQTKHELKSPAGYTTALMDHFESDPNEAGCYLSWPASHALKFRPGEITLWSGANFAGKSALLTNAMLYWLRGYSDKKEKFLLISPEFSPVMNLARLVQQICAKLPGQITGPDVIAAMAWLEGKILIYDVVGSVEIDDICNLISFAKAEHQVTGVILDNMTVLQLPHGGDVNQAQGELMTRLVEITRTTGVHLHAVCHTRKPAAGEQVSRYSIRGSSILSDLADNILCVERNEDKERALGDDKLSDEKREIWSKSCDNLLHCLKQRHGSAWVGNVKLFFDVFSMRWGDSQRAHHLSFEEVEDLNNVLGEPNSRGYQRG